MSSIRNVTRLEIHRISQEMTAGRNMGQVFNAMTDGEVSTRAQEARQWVQRVLSLLRSAPDAALVGYRQMSDDELAGVILEAIEKKKARR